ncbi:MAG: hypothetical protein NW216_05530 [Hyphomicrobium sp.]|nr:hypothetical protein [Hyphomicrobium sp.]
MLPDDIYRSKLTTAVESLRYWIPSISDVAKADEDQSDAHWRIAVAPHVHGACPFEVVLKSGQRYAVVLDGVAFDDLPAGDLAGVTALADAIAAGRVVRSSWTTAKTGTPIATRLTVDLGKGRRWTETQGAVPDPSDDDYVRTDRHYLPYRR